ncbi:DEAD/DEAH box helicase [Thorsellia kenyensis]|uniref:DEAD/DEAH box helicase n=1 Tax=Thorsellia kenyensis TaxID=1549888 RepID=A0ABV6C9S9_9GAMM
MLESENLTTIRFIWAFTEKFDLCGKIQKQTHRDWTLGRKVNIHTLHKNYGHIISDHDKTIANYLIQTFAHEKETFRLNSTLLALLHSAHNLFSDEGYPITLTLHPILLTFEPFETDKVHIEKYPDEKSSAYVDEQKLLRKHTDNVYLFESHSHETSRFLNMLKKVPIISAKVTESLIEKINNRISWYNYINDTSNIEIVTFEPFAHVWLKFEKEVLILAITHQTEDNSLQVPSAFGDKWYYMGQDRWVKRDIEQEKSIVEDLLNILEIKNFNENQEYIIPLLDAETTVRRLESVSNIKLHWLKDQHRIIKVDIKDLAFEFKSVGSVLKLDAEFVIDGEEIITLQQMLQARRLGYIALGEGESRLQFTQSLKHQLAVLSHLVNENGEVRQDFSPISGQLDDVIKAIDNTDWQNKMSQWQEPLLIDNEKLSMLRPYQKEGVKWAINLIHHGFGACLADDMGLGKTLQALKVIEHFSNKGPSLVVCPKSVLYNWKNETLKFTPTIEVTIFEMADDKDALLQGLYSKPNRLLIIGYSQLALFQTSLQTINWQMIVIDEAQQIKNPSSQRTKALLSLPSNGKLALSGTPVENNLLDIWSLFHFLNPSLLGSLGEFREHFTRVNKEEDPITELRFLVTPFILRRLKKEVLEELPEKIEINHDIELSSAERAAYEAVRLDILNKKRHMPIEILAGITRLRQICSDASLVFDNITEPSSKLLKALEIIKDALAGGHKILVFSQFVGLLHHLDRLLADSSINFSYLDGQTPLKHREEQIKAFKDDKADVFLISLKAGGTGLNLTEADTVIHLDPWWNPAVEDQASDRAYRIGQTQTVTVYRLIAKDTIEEYIIELHHAKRELALQVLDNKETSTNEEFDPAFLLSLLNREEFDNRTKMTIVN